MFGSTVLEVAIGMIFVYLLLSLLCSAVNEYIELWLQQRSKNLWKGVQLLLNGSVDDTKQKPDMNGSAADSPPGQSDIASELYQHGLVRALFRDNNTLPSYIPSRTFALALWNLASRKAGEMSASPPDGFSTTDLKKIRLVVDQLPNKELAQALGTLIDDAKGDFDKAVKNVEDWYDGAMDRVSGWYKRRVQKHLIIIGCAAALFVNADTINIAQALAQSDTLRDAVVASAERFEPSRVTARAGDAAGAGAAADSARTVESAGRQISDLRGELAGLGLPIGWARARCNGGTTLWWCKDGDPVNATELRLPPQTLSDFILKVFGIFLTGLAISQGAPFWFDLLNKIMVIRSTVKPKEKSQEQPSKDKPAPKTEVDDDADGGKG